MLKTKRRNEYTFSDESSFVTKYGNPWIEDTTPTVLYLRTKAKVSPMNKQTNYTNEVTKVKREFIAFVEHEIKSNSFYLKDYIFNIDLSEKNMAYHKVSNLRYNLYLKPVKLDTVDNQSEIFLTLTEKLNNKLKQLLLDNSLSYK